MNSIRSEKLKWYTVVTTKDKSIDNWKFFIYQNQKKKLSLHFLAFDEKGKQFKGKQWFFL